VHVDTFDDWLEARSMYSLIMAWSSRQMSRCPSKGESRMNVPVYATCYENQ
jgi:hypothetical protein